MIVLNQNFTSLSSFFAAIGVYINQNWISIYENSMHLKLGCDKIQLQFFLMAGGNLLHVLNSSIFTFDDKIHFENNEYLMTLSHGSVSIFKDII